MGVLNTTDDLERLNCTILINSIKFKWYHNIFSCRYNIFLAVFSKNLLNTLKVINHVERRIKKKNL